MKTYLIHFSYATKASKVRGRFWGTGSTAKEIEAESAQQAVDALYDTQIERYDLKGKFGDVCDIWNVSVFVKEETPAGGWRRSYKTNETKNQMDGN